MWCYRFVWLKPGTLGACLGEKRPGNGRTATDVHDRSCYSLVIPRTESVHEAQLLLRLLVHAIAAVAIRRKHLRDRHRGLEPVECPRGLPASAPRSRELVAGPKHAREAPERKD